MIIFSLIFIIIIGILSLVQYNTVESDFQNQFSDRIIKTDLTLNNSVSVLFEALNLYDSRYDNEMETILKQLSDTYVSSGNDISRINLTEYKNKAESIFVGKTDLYIINSSNIVEKTTYDPDLHLDFNSLPTFASTLTDIRNSDKFYPDQWVDSINTPGYYRKYGYYPTPDHRYIFEIGLHSDEFLKARRNIFSYKQLGVNVKEANPDMMAITFYNKNLDIIDEISNLSELNSSVSRYIPPHELNASIKKVFSEKQGSTINYGQYVIDYQYFTARKDLTPSASEMNIVSVSVYSRDTLNRSLENYFFIHLIITILAIIISVLFAMYLSRYVSQPIERIIEDIEKIARGDYSHPIRITGGKEVDRLGQSVELMVRRIIKDIEIIQKGHEEIATELERRTLAEQALLLANNKLNNLTNITRHDILNQVTCIRGYAYLAEHSTDLTETGRYGKDIQRISSRIEEMINFARDYQALGISGSTWQNLAQVIHNAVYLPFHDIISLEGPDSMVSIFADPLLLKVFYNLADNSLTHGTAGGEKIRISFVTTSEGGFIVYEDQGTGIPDSDKENIFRKGWGSGTGLGLFLIREILEFSKMAIEENGAYGSGVRFEIFVPRDQFRIEDDSLS